MRTLSKPFLFRGKKLSELTKIQTSYSRKIIPVLLVLILFSSLFSFQGSSAYNSNGRGSGSDNVEITWQGSPAPGNAMDVEISNDYVFIAASSGLLIVDISNVDELNETAFIDLPGAIGAIAITGNYACIAAGEQGLHIVDISDSENPTLVGNYDSPGFAEDVVLRGSYAYVADGHEGLRIVDISNPGNPQEIGVYRTGTSYVESVAVSGDYAYLADSLRGFRIVDISDNTRPKKTGDLDVAGTSDGIDVSGDWVYIADGAGGLRIITVEDKETPYQVHTYNTPGYAHAVVATMDRAYVADGTNGLLVLDMTTKTAPRVVDTYDTSGEARDLVLASGFTYVADYNRGMRVISMDHPGTFSEVGSYDNNGKAYGLAVVGDLLYVADGLAGLRILDTTDPYALEEVGYIDTPGTAHRVEVQGDYAFVVDTYYEYDGHEDFNSCSENEYYNCGLHIFDVSNPARPLWVASYETPGQTAGLTVVGDYVYIADGHEGLRVLDVSNPAHPREVGSYDTYGYADDVEVRQVADGHLYAYMADGNRGLRIIDVTDPEAPEGVGSFDSYWTYDLEVVSDTLLFMADFNDGIYMLNITDPAAPTLIDRVYGLYDENRFIDLVIYNNTILAVSNYYGLKTCTYNTEGMAPKLTHNYQSSAPTRSGYTIALKGDVQFISSTTGDVKALHYNYYQGPLYKEEMINVELVGDFAYTIDRQNGLAIFDVSDPVRPVLRGTYRYQDWGDCYYAIAVQGDYAYIGTDSRFLVVDIDDPDDPVLVGEYSLDRACYTYDIEVSGDYAFVTSRYDIVTLRISNPETPEKVSSYDGCYSDGGCDIYHDLEIYENYLYAVGNHQGLDAFLIENGTLIYRSTTDYGSYFRGLTVTADYIFALTESHLISHSRTDASYPTALDDISICCRGDYRGGVAVDGDYAYVPLLEYGVGIINITDPAAMEYHNELSWTYEGYNINAHEVEIRGDLLYVADGHTDLVIVDVSNRTQPNWPGREVNALFDTSGHANDMEVMGNYTYVADGNYGLTVLDTSMEGSPQQVTRNYSNGTYQGVDVVGSYAYVTTTNGLKIIDITTPSAPEEVGWFSGSDYQEVTVVGSTAYVVAGYSGLRVIDISDPENPQETGSYDTYGYARDVVVQGDYAYVADGSYGLRVIDISSNPTEAGYYDTNNAYGIDVRDNYIYLADYSEESLYVIDVSDPRSPQFISQYSVGERAYDVSVNGDYAYVASSLNGLKIIDISEPTSLIEAGHIDTPGTAQRIMVTGDFVYIADSGRGIRIVDAYYTVNQQQHTHLSAGDARSVALYNDYAFMANYELGLTIENIGTPSNPYRVSILEEADHALDLDYSGGYVTIANEIRGVQIVDVWTPSAPILDGTLPLDGGSINHLVVEGDFAYVTGNNPDFRIVDISDTVDPLESGSLDNTDNGDLVVSGNTVYIAGNSGVKGIDVSDSTNPQNNGDYGGNSCTDVVIQDGYAYCSGGEGLQVISLSNDDSGSQETEGQAYGVAIEGEYVFIADSVEGIVVFKVSDPTNPQRVGSFHTPAARHMVIRDNYLYLADAEAGLLVLHVNYEGNQRPSAAITSIEPSPTYEGEDVYFVGSGSDPDGTIEGYQWRSSRDGLLSDSDVFYSDSLSIGIHTIYFKVKDNASVWSKEVTSQLTVKSRGGGGDGGGGGEGGGGSGGDGGDGSPWGPVATISSIEPNPANEGENIDFKGYGFDPNSTIVTYHWRSSLDGALSNQSYFSANNLSAGIHLIYFKVQNETGIWSEERSQSLEINATIFKSKESDDSFVIPKNVVYSAGALVAVAGVSYVLRSGILSKK